MPNNIERVSASASAVPDKARERHREFGDGLVFVHGTQIRFLDFSAREDEHSIRSFDLNDYWLPATPFRPSPTPVGSYPHLVQGIAASMLDLGRRISPSSKDGYKRISTALNTLTKFIEYGWINGYYSFEDWTDVATVKLAEALGLGGWTGALRIDERTQKVIADSSLLELNSFVGRSKTSLTFGYAIRENFRATLGTNARGQELTDAKRAILDKLGLKGYDESAESSERIRRVKKRSSVSGMGQTHLRQELAAINLLAEHLGDTSLSFIPYPDTVKTSKKYGRAGRRTANLSPESVAALLKEAYWWIDKAADPILGAVEDVYKGLAENAELELEPSPEVVWNSLICSRHFATIEELTGENITSIGSRGLSFKQVIYCLASACFVTIAFLNARRRDEVQHKKIGLHRKCLSVVDRQLGLYQCEFFIEKSHKIYVPFYVGKFTRTAIRILERLSDAARAIDAIRGVSAHVPQNEKEDKLFQLPRIVGKVQGGKQWFAFNASSEGISRGFVTRALGADSQLRVHPHMFRRAYALIFHYRYENATLQALAQQLGHFDLETVRVYISDRATGTDEHSATSFGRLTQAQIKAQHQKIRELNGEIQEVGRERVLELVEEIVGGSSAASQGGFVRLIRRFHQIMGRRLDYSGLDRRKKVQFLAGALTNMGHVFHPMRHANCVASVSRKNKAAGCYSERTKGLGREDASAATCTTCPYGHWTSGHTAALLEDEACLARQVAERQSMTLTNRNDAIQLANLRAMLRLRAQRLEGASGCAV